MKTTSLELSKALEEAGAAQGIVPMMWAEVEGKVGLYHIGLLSGHDKPIASSFDCHELLEGLPDVVVDASGQRYCLEVYKFGSLYVVCYANPQGGCVCPDDFSSDTPAEALGKLKLWCLENGHCDE